MNWLQRYRVRLYLHNALWVFPLLGMAAALAALLQRSAGRSLCEPEDRALADAGDLQGVGGTPGGQRGTAP